MKKIFLFILFLFYMTIANATVQVARYQTTSPVQVCQPNDTNSSCGGGGSSSQWTGTGTGPLTYSSGNVGIGSVAPVAPLQVVGTIKATSFIGDGSGITGISGSISGLTTNKLSKATSSTTIGDSQVSDNGTNVGIGITSTTNTLTIQGASSGSGIDINNGSTNKASINLTSHDNVNLPTAGAPGLQMNNDNTGSSATSAIGGNLSDAGSNIIGSLVSWGIVTSKNVNTAGSGKTGMYIYGSSGASTNEIMHLQGDGLVAIDRTSGPPGAVLELNKLGSNPYFSIKNSSTGDIFLVNNVGNIGIANVSPGYQLDVTGTVRATAFIGNGAGLTGLPSGSGTINSGTIGRTAVYSGSTTVSSSSVMTDTGTNIGVGTINPSSLLVVTQQSSTQSPVSNSTIQIVGTDANPLRITLDTHNNSSASGTALMVRRSRGTSASPSAISANDVIFAASGRGYGTTGYGAASTGLMNIKANQAFTDTNMGTYISFDTTPDNSTTAAEQMRITGAGNVAIGTTIPQSKLDVTGSDSGTTITNASAAMSVVTNINTTNNNFEDLSFSSANASGANVVGAKIAGVNVSHTAGSESTDMAFLTRSVGVGAERVRILANGNVGIGSINPGQLLDVQGTVRALFFSGNGAALTGVTATAAAAGPTNAVQYNSGSSTTAGSSSFIFDGTNVGIGSANPKARLDLGTTGLLCVAGVCYTNTSGTGNLIGSANPVFSGNQTVPSIRGGSANSSSVTITATTNAASTTDKISFITGPSGTNERMEINDAGNVGIGTLAPRQQLDVAGTLAPSAPFIVTSQGNVGIGKSTANAPLDVVGSVIISTGTAGQTVCWKSDKSLGQCTSIVGAGGGCTCT